MDQLSDLYSFHLTVVSKLLYGDYASGTSKKDFLECKEILETRDWITYHETLPNEKVMKLASTCHVGILPSLSDTYGYSVLEMQACGCPCVTTDIRALGEINSEECGWLCHIEHNQFGEAIYSSFPLSQKMEIRRQLQEELARVLPDILSNPQSIRQKGYACLQRIKTCHDPEEYARKLRDIYNS